MEHTKMKYKLIIAFLLLLTVMFIVKDRTQIVGLCIVGLLIILDVVAYLAALIEKKVIDDGRVRTEKEGE